MWLSVALAVTDDAPHTATLVYVLTGVCSFFAAIIAILAGIVWTRLRKRPEEVAAAAKASDDALDVRISAFSLKLDAHAGEARQSSAQVIGAVHDVSRDVAVVKQRVDDLVDRIDDVEVSHVTTRAEVARNREHLVVLHAAVTRDWSDDYTPLPGPLPEMPPPRRRRTAPPAPRAAWGYMKAPGATPQDKPDPLPAADDDDNER